MKRIEIDGIISILLENTGVKFMCAACVYGNHSSKCFNEYARKLCGNGDSFFVLEKNINMSDEWINNLIESEEVATPRFFLDKRAGCAAIRDRQHPKYDEDYQGLHNDTPDVVEYIHGFHNHAKKCWDMKPDDIVYLENYCASLNGA